MPAQLLNKPIGSTGYGLMGLTWRPKPQPLEASIAVMRAALLGGANFWNGGTFYGTPEYNSIHLLNAYFTRYPEDARKVVISIKGGYNSATHAPDGSPEYLKREIEGVLEGLEGKCFVDVYEPARVDLKVPIEETVGAIAEFVKAGKIGGVGLSECGAETIKRAAKVTKIASVEVEFSLFSTDILTNNVASTCATLSIPLIAYAPLSRGFLTGSIRSHADLPPNDLRKNFPRFSEQNFPKNMDLVHEVESIAAKKSPPCTAGNIALAWVKKHSGREGMPVIIPIPGTTTEERLSENMREVELSEEEFKMLNAVLERCEVAGRRYPDAHKALEFA